MNTMTKQIEAMKLALDALEGADNIDVDMSAAITALREALAEPTPMTQARAEDLAHRRCKRYVFIDTEAPYQFNGHTLMDFVRDIERSKV